MIPESLIGLLAYKGQVIDSLAHIDEFDRPMLSRIVESMGSDVLMPGRTAILPGTGSGLIPQLAPYILNNPMGGFVRPWDVGHSSVTEVTWGEQVQWKISGPALFLAT